MLVCLAFILLFQLSYGAYVRNNISQNRALIERSFTHHADVPELDKLLDQRYRVCLNDSEIVVCYGL